MTLIEEKQIVELGVEKMDHDHSNFVNLVNQLETCDDDNFPALFELLPIRMEKHFAMENQLMEEFNFPAILIHQEEHSRILEEIKQVKAKIDDGAIDEGRTFVKESLIQWFLNHLNTMDSCLAADIAHKTQ